MTTSSRRTDAKPQRPGTKADADMLQRSEKLYAALLAAIPSSVLLVDRQMRIVSANQNFLEKAQRQESATIGQPVSAVFPPLILEHMDLARRIQNAFDRNESTRGERLTYRTPGLGSRIYYYSLTPFSWEGAVEHVMLLMEDVTDHVRLGEEVRRAERHLASVVESASDIVLSTTVDGRILTWNPAAEKLSGYTADDVLNQRFFELCAAPHQIRVRGAFERVRSANGFGTAEWDLVTKTGTLVPVSWVGSAMKDDSGNVVAVVALGRDLSERRKFEGQLLQSQKLAALGVLASGIAHEIRNPLSVSSSAAQFLLEEPEDPCFRAQCVAKILEGIRRASVVIEDLLRFARPGSGDNMVALDLVPIVREAVALTAHQANIQRVKLETTFAPDPIRISGVSSLLQQVFVNMVLNALAAMPDGGLLQVAVDERGQEARVRIADTGRGLSVADSEKIFDPFYTTMPVGKGTGLGLSISYSIVRQHFGFIEVESAEGQGSTFTVRLPLLMLEKEIVEPRSRRANR